MKKQKSYDLKKDLRLKKLKGHKIISVYFTLGYPNFETSISAMLTAAEAGADIIEIGLPFSDPMADGPTIQHTNQIAIENGLEIHMLEEALKTLSQTGVHLVVMSYSNIIFQYPLNRFKSLYQKFNLSGVIIPDLPPEHANSVSDLSPIYLIGPNTPEGRIEFLCQNTHGFIYIMSSLGTTGSQYQGDERLLEINSYLAEKHPDLPKLQGFGIDSISTAIKAIEYGADGIIIGSHLLRLLGDEGKLENVKKFIEELRKELKTRYLKSISAI